MRREIIACVIIFLVMESIVLAIYPIEHAILFLAGGVFLLVFLILAIINLPVKRKEARVSFLPVSKMERKESYAEKFQDVVSSIEKGNLLGVPELDGILRVQNGSITTIFSQDEKFIRNLTSSRKTYYITTSRSPEEIEKEIAKLRMEPEIIFLSGERVKYLIDSALNEIKEKGDSGINILIDDFSFYLHLYDNPEIYRRLLASIKDLAVSTGGRAFLQIKKGIHPKETENILLHESDFVFEVNYESILVRKKDGEILSNPLRVKL